MAVRWRWMAAAGVLPLAPPLFAVAQVRASERATVSQTIDGTVIEVSYGRPRLRGRTAFGGVVHWGEIWTPGANWATTLTVSKGVRIDGQAVAAGSYSVWIVPAERDWTFALHRQAKRYHLQRPKLDEMAVRLPITPSAAPLTELLTFSFPETRRDGATLRLQWGPTAVALRIDVEATAATRRRLTLQEVSPYLGDYVAWIYGESGDSTRMLQRLTFEDGRLAGTIDDGRRRFELIPNGERHRFLFEIRDAEGPYDVELDGPVEFTVGPDGRAAGFQMKGIEQPLWMRGVRAGPDRPQS